MNLRPLSELIIPNDTPYSAIAGREAVLNLDNIIMSIEAGIMMEQRRAGYNYFQKSLRSQS